MGFFDTLRGYVKPMNTMISAYIENGVAYLPVGQGVRLKLGTVGAYEHKTNSYPVY